MITDPFISKGNTLVQISLTQITITSHPRTNWKMLLKRTRYVIFPEILEKERSLNILPLRPEFNIGRAKSLTLLFIAMESFRKNRAIRE